ncbi:hypothetical protein GTPV_gp082 [Goatpox virus Pellor]|uniref:mRNA decapping enzyme n=1 Tax=Goatpox virus TaxID=186805 RepID=A0A1B2LPP6_9POXV|nr:hypothetical protein GTPV_gp082 [Goatpox virus Pellor]AOA33044.1 hypothetical protein GTPV_gp082 [Goatpox virus]QEJ79084.1 mRNA decapping enzyme [Goatpox virus]
MLTTMIETDRENVTIERVNEIPDEKNTHVFAICITSDGKPLIAARRNSFAFQEIMSQRVLPTSILKVSKHLLKYMYNNEIKEIQRRLLKGSYLNVSQMTNNSFEELILLGGKINKSESISDCLQREIQEESDSNLTIKCFGNKCVKLTIFDKLFDKTYISYCTTCYITETISQAISSIIYNVEIRALKSLFECFKNDKYHYLLFIYNTLVNSK